ncbi:DUF938 domain-containing protein [Erythrobacter litoralis]|uniref:DUF938 domain-containing protein n=1 Tax=Erythrobacter litoralis TaxID=39960 RepID=UPI002435749D|nr:DUF938 domain-containing protein [Erythrobacter litoralis]MDG6078731.1 DUF938 domain-containing protein [Erythrobacter litoralis]
MKRHAPAAARNAEPISEVLAHELPQSGLVLEIASGTGEHAVFMARGFPHLDWQPSDRDADGLASIEAWREDAGPANLLPPIAIDASAPTWPIDHCDAILCINMVHISPWSATEGLLRGAGRLLANDRPLILYGPYIEQDVETAPSNLAFDASLKARDSAWGLREVSAMDRLARANGFRRSARYEMPANNIMLIYRRSA